MVKGCVMHQEAVRFGIDQHLVGVLTAPEKPTALPVMLFLNAGMIHRVGPSRIYVRLARHLAALGFTSLRFDFSGVGDSHARSDSLSLVEMVVDDARRAMDYVETRLGPSQFVLTGHCSGAWAAFLVASEDARVVGAVVMNPEGEEAGWVEYDRQRKTSQYYENYYRKGVLTDSQRWRKLLTGKADYQSIFRNVAKNILWYRVSSAAFRLRVKLDPAAISAAQPDTSELLARVVSAFLERRIRLLLAFSNGSSAIEHTHAVIGKELAAMNQAGIVTEVIIPNADHTFTLLAGQQALIEQIEAWSLLFSAPPLAEPAALPLDSGQEIV